MNKVIISGYVVRDADLNYIGEGVPKMSFCLGVNRSYQKDKDNKKSDFINFELFGKRAENLCQYVTKGKQLIVEGELNIDNYEKDGEKRSFTKVKVDRLEFVGSNSNTNTENKNNNVEELQEFNVDDEEDIEDFIPF